MKFLTLPLIAGVLLFATNSCQKFPDLEDPERIKDISLTYYDTLSTFSEYSTYAIVDTVFVLEAEDDTIISTPSDYSKDILDIMNQRLAQYGLTKVDSSANPDLLINAHVLNLEVTSVGVGGGWWDWWYYYPSYPYYGYPGSGGWWGYPGYSYWYPYYYPYYYTSSFGSVVMEAIDFKNRDEDTETMRMIWTGVVAGTTNSTGQIKERITTGVNECFDQSPYLGY